MNKPAASAAQLAKCILILLIHVQLLTPSHARTNKNVIAYFTSFSFYKNIIAYFTSWHTSIFGEKLRTIEVENP